MDFLKNEEEFFETLKKEILNEFAPEIRDDFIVETTEVIKTNDRRLHGVLIRIKDEKIAPAFYVEEIIDEYGCEDIKEIADFIVSGYIASIGARNNASKFCNISLRYEDIKDNITIQLVDEEKNSSRLEKLVSKSVGNGYVMVPYIEVSVEDCGISRFAVTSSIAESENYDIDLLFRKGLMNLTENNEPRLADVTKIMKETDDETANPFNEDFRLSDTERLYVLTNKRRVEGAVTLFYPGLMERISGIIGGSYYALPSSIHEFLIVPEKGNTGVQRLKDMVKSVNEKVVGEEEMLSNRVMKYDPTVGELITV